MDVAVLLLLPVVGGYIFARTWNLTKYAAWREDGHRLYFRAAFYAVFLFSISIELRLWALSESSHYRDYENLLKGILEPLLKDPDKPYQIPLAIASVYSLFIAYPVGKLLNLVIWKRRALRNAVSRDDFERLLHDAVRRAVPVAVTMENRKVYIGFVIRTYDPTQARKALALLPLVSGYRSDADGRLVLTTKYSDVYGTLDRDDPSERLGPPLEHLTVNDFEIVLPVDKIHSLGFFDLVAYTQFGQQSAQSRSSIDAIAAELRDVFSPPPYWRP